MRPIRPPRWRARALRALNLMATGVVSNTDALLRGFASAEAFASRVRAIAGAQPPASRPSAGTWAHDRRLVARVRVGQRGVRREETLHS